MLSEDVSSFPLIHTIVRENYFVVSPLRTIFSGEQVRDFNLFFRAYKQQPLHRMILDISQSDYASSEGLGCLTACWQWHQEKQERCFALVIPSDPENYLIELFSITNLNHTMSEVMHTTLASATQYVTERGHNPR